MAYAILLNTPYGWTDNLGQHEGSANRWDSEAAAEAAIREIARDFAASPASFRVVDAEDLETMDLVA